MQNSKLKEIIYLNGKFILRDKAKISVLEPGFLCGFGLFETMRSYNNKIIYLDEHLKRIKNSCRLIDLRFSYSLGKLKKIIKKAAEINGFQDAYVRLTLSKAKQGTDTSVIVRKYRPYPAKKYRKGFSAEISGFRQNENCLLARLKTTNRLLYELSFNQAKNRGFDEAVILNHRGYITEASRSNIFLVKDKDLLTPFLECGCLDGVTRRVIFNLAGRHQLKVYEGNFTVQDLCSADEAFLTNSLMGVMPLVSIEKHMIGKGRCGKITDYLRKKYDLLIKSSAIN